MLKTQKDSKRTSEKFLCNCCNTHFSTRYSLNRHRRLKIDRNSDYKCKYWGVQCGGAIYLEAHYNTHAEIFPYLCSFWDKRFEAKKKLNCHIPHWVKSKEFIRIAFGKDKSDDTSTSSKSVSILRDPKEEVSYTTEVDYNNMVASILENLDSETELDLDKTQSEIDPREPLVEISQKLNKTTSELFKGMYHTNFYLKILIKNLESEKLENVWFALLYNHQVWANSCLAKFLYLRILVTMAYRGMLDTQNP